MTSLPLARRTHQIEPFRVMELVKRARELEAAGRSIIHLSIGEPDFTAAPTVVQALKHSVDRGDTGYTAALGVHALREAIARHSSESYGVELDPARVAWLHTAVGSKLSPESSWARGLGCSWICWIRPRALPPAAREERP